MLGDGGAGGKGDKEIIRVTFRPMHTVISMFFFWPVLITQIWGLVNQSQLDDRALAAAERGMQSSASSLNVSGERTLFCTHCGSKMNEEARF